MPPMPHTHAAHTCGTHVPRHARQGYLSASRLAVAALPVTLLVLNTPARYLPCWLATWAVAGSARRPGARAGARGHRGAGVVCGAAPGVGVGGGQGGGRGWRKGEVDGGVSALQRAGERVWGALRAVRRPAAGPTGGAAEPSCAAIQHSTQPTCLMLTARPRGYQPVATTHICFNANGIWHFMHMHE